MSGRTTWTTTDNVGIEVTTEHEDENENVIDDDSIALLLAQDDQLLVIEGDDTDDLRRFVDRVTEAIDARDPGRPVSFTLPTVPELLADYDKWSKQREAYSRREEHNPVSSSQWQASDDEGVELAGSLASALREKRKVWTCSVHDRENEEDTVTVHLTEEACWESLRESYDPHGECDDEPPVAIVDYLEAGENLRITIDVHEV